MNLKHFLIFLLFILAGCSKKDDPSENIKSEMLGLVNELRLNGCYCGITYMPPVNTLKWNVVLENAADLHAKDMYFNNYFEHIGLDGSSPIQRAMQLGYSGQYVVENIAKGYTKSSFVVNAWKNSDDHCKAMMDSSHIEMGVSEFGNYWVLELGR